MTLYIVVTKDGLEIARGGEKKKSMFEGWMKRFGVTRGWILIKKHERKSKKQ